MLHICIYEINSIFLSHNFQNFFLLNVIKIELLLYAYFIIIHMIRRATYTIFAAVVQSRTILQESQRCQNIFDHEECRFSGIMLVCKREKFNGPRVRNTRAFGNFSSRIPRLEYMPHNNLARRAHLHRQSYISKATDVIASFLN